MIVTQMCKIKAYCILLLFKLKIINNFCGVRLLVAQLVEVLRYKSEGRGFDSR
jgi:hypothetical protein